MANTATMMMSREEPLIKQLARSRALNPRGASLSPTSSNRGSRSASQPAPRHRMPFSPLSTYSHNLSQTQLLPFSMVFPSTSSSQNFSNLPLDYPRSAPIISISQPDLTKLVASHSIYSPPTVSRCHSPLPPSSSQCGSLFHGALSPLNLSRASTPTITTAYQPQAPPPDLINSIYTSPSDVYHERENREKSPSYYLRPEGNGSQVKFSISPTNSESGLSDSRQRSVSPVRLGHSSSHAPYPPFDPYPGHDNLGPSVTCHSNGNRCPVVTSTSMLSRQAQDKAVVTSHQVLPAHLYPTTTTSTTTQITFFPCPLCPPEQLHQQHQLQHKVPQQTHWTQAPTSQAFRPGQYTSQIANEFGFTPYSQGQWPTLATEQVQTPAMGNIFQYGGEEIKSDPNSCIHRVGMSTFAGACHLCKVAHFDRLTVTAPSTPTGNRSPSKDQWPNVPRNSIPHVTQSSSSMAAEFGPSVVSAAAGSGAALFASICSASGNSQGAIDNRIEQAMDLVKSHLMNAVRSEVEELKEKIIGLETKIDHLQSENEILKAHAPSDVVQQLPQLAPTPPQMILAPPPAANNANMNNIMAGPSQPVAIQQPQPQQQQQQPQPQAVVSNGMINGHVHPQQINNGPTAQQN